MENTSNLLKSYENEWKTLDDKEKLIQLGKLKMIEELRLFLDAYAESITRELKINRCETDEDCINPKPVEVNREYKDPELVGVEEIKVV